MIPWIVNATGNVLIANARSGQRAKKLMKMSEKLHLFYITGGAIHITLILFFGKCIAFIILIDGVWKYEFKK